MDIPVYLSEKVVSFDKGFVKTSELLYFCTRTVKLIEHQCQNQKCIMEVEVFGKRERTLFSLVM